MAGGLATAINPSIRIKGYIAAGAYVNGLVCLGKKLRASYCQPAVGRDPFVPALTHLTEGGPHVTGCTNRRSGYLGRCIC